MAKYNSLVFNEVSGKIGTLVLGKNGVVRRQVTPTNPDTAAQQAVRNGFTAASGAWKLLTATQRAGWATLAAQVTLTNAIGKSYNPTGRRLFVSCCQNSLTVAQGAPTTAPASMPSVAPVTGFGAYVQPPSVSHANGTITLAGTFDLSAAALVIRATPPLSPDRTSAPANAYRVLTTVPLGGTLPTPDALGSLYAARFGPAALGAKVSFVVFQTNPGGFVGPLSRADTLSGAPSLQTGSTDIDAQPAVSLRAA